MSGMPFITSARVTLNFAAGGGFIQDTQVFDSSRLTNSFRVPLQIDEIRINSEVQPIGPGGGINVTDWAYLDMKLGKNSITDLAVPTLAIAPYRIGFGADSYPLTLAQTAQALGRRIIPRKPLILPPGLGFSAVASLPAEIAGFLNSLGQSFTQILTITLVGRFLDRSDKIPEFNEVPMISHVLLTQNDRRSLEQELRNPLAKPLTVQRLVMAAPTRTGVTIANNNIGVTRLTQVQFHFPNSEAATEDPIEIVHGLFGQMKVWPTEFVMPANTRIRAQITPNAAEAGPDPFTGYIFTLIGSRPEVIP